MIRTNLQLTKGLLHLMLVVLLIGCQSDAELQAESDARVAAMKAESDAKVWEMISGWADPDGEFSSYAEWKQHRDAETEEMLAQLTAFTAAVRAWNEEAMLLEARYKSSAAGSEERRQIELQRSELMERYHSLFPAGQPSDMQRLQFQMMMIEQAIRDIDR